MRFSGTRPGSRGARSVSDMALPPRYDALRCDLCASTACRRVVWSGTGRTMRSDRVILSGHLCKLECSRCGLVRAGGQDFEDDLSTYYSDAYDSGESDHLFYTGNGPVRRSAVFADWICAAT